MIWLPVSEPVASEERARARRLPDRALVVEDEPDIRRLLSELLASLGVQAVGFGSGEEVIEFFSHEHAPSFDLAIVDIRLGAMDGIELGHRLLKQHGCTGVLLVSGDEPGPRLAQFEDQPVVFQRKPLSLRGLQDVGAVLMTGWSLQLRRMVEADET